jgi:hypothetical protein
MEADRVGVDRFFEDIGDEAVGVAIVVFVVVVAQREIAEFHLPCPRRRKSPTNSWRADAIASCIPDPHDARGENWARAQV